jgi:splicing factor 3B subunit 2
LSINASVFLSDFSLKLSFSSVIGKRGIEKPPFDLPEFIKKTGIQEMRAALQEKEEAKGLKSKMREKVRPKLGKIDIDYQKLHDAFFKWQTKPRMTHHGDLYYEGKEFEIRLKEKKPGDLSDDLRTALGMPVGPNAHKVPPPWLISMQRYGPPPSYPNLKIPGLNAPIPDGCSFGYHAGGWGKPPVDETGKPLYGDVFGTSDSGHAHQMPVEEVDQTLWGEMEPESEEEESDEEEEEDEDADEESVPMDTSGMQTPIVDAGMATPSGMSSVGAPMPGQETPELIELRKRKIEADMEGGETPNLYTILPERKNERIGGGLMGSTHTYDLPSSSSI